MLTNVMPIDELRSVASRRAKGDEYKSVRHALVEEEVGKGWICTRQKARVCPSPKSNLRCCKRFIDGSSHKLEMKRKLRSSHGSSKLAL
jgi:hypothetical protein